MKTENIQKRFTDWDDYFASDEFKKLYSGVAKYEVERKKQIRKKSRFVRAFTTAADPKYNYGDKFRLYCHYVTPEGLSIIKEESPVSIVTNQPLTYTIIVEGFLVFTDIHFDRKHARSWLINNKITVS